MNFGRQMIAAGFAAAVLSGAAIVPLATGLAFESEAETREADAALIAQAGLATLDPGSSPFDAVDEPVIDLDRAFAIPAIVPAPETAVVAMPATDAELGIDAELTCLAKIVRHEAGNQSREGQLAVAQVVMNRVVSPLFPNTICEVAMQRGQFFNVHAYNPPRDARWETAIEVALDARNAMSPPVIADAVFFHAARANPPFFRTRQRVARLGDHVFYR